MISLHRDDVAGKRRLDLPNRRLLSRGYGLVCVWYTAALLASGSAVAQVLISPVVVELGARQRTVAVTVTLSDKASGPMRLQADVLRWEQDVQGHDVTEPSDDLLVTPPIADLKPGDRQVFRLALRGARPSPEELTYRLILEDIAESPAATEAAPGMNINFRMRYDLPVMVAPVSKVVNVLRWKPCVAATTPATKPSAAEACVRLLNAGNRRVKVQTLTLAGAGWQQDLPLKDGVNVLAGAEREWRVVLAPGHSGALNGVQVLTARGEKLQAETGGF